MRRADGAVRRSVTPPCGVRTHTRSSRRRAGCDRLGGMGEPYLTAKLQGFGTTIFAEMSALAVATGHQPRPGLPRRGRARTRCSRPRSTPSPRAGATSTRPGRASPSCGTPSSPTSTASTASSSIRTARCWSRAARRRPSPPPCSPCWTPVTRPSPSSPTTTATPPCISMAGAVRRPVTLRPPDYALDVDALRAAVTPRTRLILLNSPHNPTGKVFDGTSCSRDRRVAQQHDLVVVADEVYEHLTFDGVRARPDRHAARDVRAHGHHRLGRQVVQLHGLEGRLGDGAGPADHRGAHGQAVPDLRGQRPVPVRGGGRARPARRLLRRRPARPRAQA